MAGIAGMGTPDALKPSVPEAPQIDLSNVAQVPDVASMPAPPVDLDALFDQTMGASEPDLDAIFDQTMGEASQDASIAQESEASLADDMTLGDQLKMVGKDFLTKSPYDILTGKGESAKLFEDTGTRLKASFAKTDKEKLYVLNQAYGSENVKKAKDGFLIKKEGKWKKFDSDAWELVNDIADFGGDVVEQGITEAGTAAGLFAATGETAAAPLTGGASLLAVPGTIAAARAAGSIAGTGARDAIAQGLLDIPRDPERSALAEYGTNAGLNIIGGRVAQWAEGKLAARALQKAKDTLRAPEDLFETEIKNIKEAQSVLKDSGLYHEELSLLEQVPSSPEAKEIFNKVAKDPSVRQVLKEKNDAMEQANRSFLDSISKFTGNKPGVGQRVGNYIAEARQAEGKLIGEYRSNFLRDAGDGELPVPALQQKVAQIADNLGFQVKDNQLVKPTVDQLQDLGYSKEGAESLSRLVEGLNEKLYNNGGKLTAKELDSLYNRYSQISKNVWDRGEGADKAFRKTVTQMKDAIRDAYTDKIGVVLDGNEGYKKALGEFSFIEKNRAQLEDILDKDKISSMAFAKHVFSKGADGLDDLRAAKAVLKNRPDLFDELTGQFYSDIVREATDQGTGKVAWSKVNKNISKLGPEMLEEMMGKGAMKKFNALQTLGENLEKVSAASGITGAQQASIIKNMIVGLTEGSGFGVGNAAIQTLGQLDKGDALKSVLEKEGIEAFLKTAPKAHKALLTKILQGFKDSAYKVGKSDALRVGLRQAGINVAKPKEEN